MQKYLKNILLVLLGINIIYVISGVIHFPLGGIDVYSIWLLKAKEFYVNGIFPLSNLNQFPYSHPQYPILLPLIYSFIYQIIDGVKEFYVLILSPLAYISILVLSYKLFRKLGIKENISLIFTYIYSMFGPLLAGGGRMHAGEADIFLVLICWGILHLVFNYLNDKKFKWIIFMATLIATASQIKMEGVLPAILILFIPGKIKQKLIGILISVVPAILWTLLRIKSGLIADFGYIVPSISELIFRLTSLLIIVFREMANYRNWYIFWPIFWLSIYLIKQKSNLFLKIITQCLLSMVLLFTFNFLFSSLDINIYAPSSIDRIMLQLSPYFFTIFVLNYVLFSYEIKNL